MIHYNPVKFLIIVIPFLLCISSCSLFKKNDSIKIGFMGSFTEGKYSDWGNNTRDGALLAIEEFNKAGGVNGKTLKLVIKDDRHDPVYAGKLLDEFMKEGISIIIGPVLSSVATAIVPLADKKGILLISPSVSTDLLTGKDDSFLRVGQGNANHGTALAEYVTAKKRWHSVAVTIDDGNPASSEGWRDAFIKRFKEGGGVIVFSTGFRPGGDLKKMAENLVKRRPSGILIVGGAIDAAAVAQEIRKLDSKIPLAAAGTAMSEELLVNGGGSVDEMLLAPGFFDDNNSPGFNDFKKRFKKDFGRDPLYSVVYGYDAAAVLCKALAATDPGNDSASVKNRILALKKFSGPIGDFKIDKYGDTLRQVTIVTVRNGKFVKAE